MIIKGKMIDVTQMRYLFMINKEGQVNTIAELYSRNKALFNTELKFLFERQFDQE